MEQGFDEGSYIIGATIFIFASVLSSYIILLGTLEPKEQQDERLVHLTREILHEINLPIATIDANLAMLQKSTNSPKAEKRISRIRSALARLQRLYAELAYSIKKEILVVEKECFDLKATVEERVAIQEDMGRNPFVLELKSCMIKVDRIGLEQIVDNIIENAMKYSQGGQPIEITLESAQLSIRDYGIGMDANQIMYIYERYYQGGRGYEGEGIGLALVKSYCDEAGIGIKINSKQKQGTQVILSFDEVALQ